MTSPTRPKVPFFPVPDPFERRPLRKRKAPTRRPEPTDSDRASFVSWMLVLDPATTRGGPHTEARPWTGPEANAHLVAYVQKTLDELSALAQRTPKPPRDPLPDYWHDLNSRNTLRYCRAVMARHLLVPRNGGLHGYVLRGSEREFIRGFHLPLARHTGGAK